jgi:putative addiction module component (TIGR02574 family)
MITAEQVLEEATLLKPVEQAQLVDHLLSMLDHPDQELDKMWAEEAESRLDAYKNGHLKAVSLEKVLSKYK